MDKYHRGTLIIFAAMMLVLVFMAGYDGSAETADPNISNSAIMLSDTQRNSIAMLNYVTVLTQQINASKNSRLYLEEAYSALINNISPNAVDARTLDQIVGILDTLENYRMVAAKRDRLKYIYEQNCAQAIRSIVPSPLNVLSIVQSRSLPAIAFSVVTMAVDSVASYTTFTEEANVKLIESGWALDDEQSAVLHNSRKETFNYMVSIVNEQDLPGELALNENYVDEFVAIKNNSNVIQQIQFLESNNKTYQAFGDYWLALAESYYNHGDYAKCLDAISTYESLGVRIFRKDHDLTSALPLAIIAAGETKDISEYVSLARDYCEKILANTNNDEWALRYFAAHTYVDLFDKTKDSNYLKQAYVLTVDNVNLLVNEQREQNAAYLAEIVTAPVSKGASSEVRNEIDQYNKFLREERKAEMPPIYEPLLLNCELLFMLADELEIAENEKAKVDGILHENGKSLFLIPSVDAKYWFTQAAEMPDANTFEVIFTGSELSIPVECVSSRAVIKMTVLNKNADAPSVYDDWKLQRVERERKDNIAAFTAIFQSPSAQKHAYNEGASVKVEVLPKEDMLTDTLTFDFFASENKAEWWEVVKVWEESFTFRRVN